MDPRKALIDFVRALDSLLDHTVNSITFYLIDLIPRLYLVRGGIHFGLIE
jgi:hypothetical protein